MRFTPAVFLGRDNTLNIDDGYNPKLEVYNDVIPFLSILHLLGIKKIVISNQSGVRRKFTTNFMVYQFNVSLLEKVLLPIDPNATIDNFYWCPHLPTDNCACRKPSSGLIYKAAIENDINLSRSVMIGDKMSDYQAGLNAGIQSILLDRESNYTGFRSGIRVAKSLTDALPMVKWLCIDSHRRT